MWHLHQEYDGVTMTSTQGIVAADGATSGSCHAQVLGEERDIGKGE